jgi:GNAT superfamily N-acetyltransferase
VDDQPVWSVTCFFVAKPYRHRGVTTALLRAAINSVRDQDG